MNMQRNGTKKANIHLQQRIFKCTRWQRTPDSAKKKKKGDAPSQVILAIAPESTLRQITFHIQLPEPKSLCLQKQLAS